MVQYSCSSTSCIVTDSQCTKYTLQKHGCNILLPPLVGTIYRMEVPAVGLFLENMVHCTHLNKHTGGQGGWSFFTAHLRVSLRVFSLKGMCHENVDLHFFHDSNPSGPLINRLKYFRLSKSKILFNLYFHDRCVQS